MFPATARVFTINLCRPALPNSSYWFVRCMFLHLDVSNMALPRFVLLSFLSSSLANCNPRGSYTTTSSASATRSGTQSPAFPSAAEACFSPSANRTAGPVVDLTYALHAPQIVSSPDSRTYYNFSNIRYAAPPVDSLRFQPPLDPINNRSAGVQDGTYGKICPQAYTPWQSSAAVEAPPGEAESEDCLFLDVVVPEEAWSQRCNTSRPVIVWIHGGGFQIGAKWGSPLTNPLGLLDRSFDNGSEGAIWIGIQYRVSENPAALSDLPESHGP